MTPQLQAELAKKMEDLKVMMAAAGMSNGVPAAAGAAPSPWGAPAYAAPPAIPAVLGWSVEVEVQAVGKYGPGSVNVSVAFPPETFPQAAEIVQAMIQQGARIYVRTPKPAGGGFGAPRPAGGGWGR